MSIEVAPCTWKPCWRIIARDPKRFSSEAVVDPEHLNRLDALTDDPSRIIMAAFTNPSHEGSRFSDGNCGVLYVSNHLKTAIAETKHHRGLFMEHTQHPPHVLVMQVYTIDLDGTFHDLRGQREALSCIYDDNEYRVYHDNDYTGSQCLARRLCEDGSDGIIYDSMRQQDGGECVALFNSGLWSNAQRERHLYYVWDSKKIDAYDNETGVIH